MIKSRSKKNSSAEVPRRRRVSDDTVDATPSRPSTTYQRNRTLSGVHRASLEESPRTKAHSLTIQRRKIGGIFTIVLAAVIVLTILLTQLMAQVSVTSSTRQLNAPFEGDAYQRVINEYLGLNPAERLRFTLNEEKLAEYVAAQLPEVESFKVSGVRNIVETQFAVTFREPVAGWQINGKQYYVDKDGVVFDNNYYAKPDVQIIDESGISPEQGTTVASGRLLGFLGRVVTQGQGRGYTVAEALLPAGTTRELDIRLVDVPARIKFSIDRGAGEQVEDMDRALKHLTSKNISAEYVDVRVSGRAAYR